ncbi:Hypothetical_protein [Hexamita inflata]|uniref:Hypothetical_protein n=1 Tax=Hexamita inflata TaxID=28002 RepID=A0AA86PKG1_9EUKA|nr:Hypothetical protein HINF_LOCUS28924 [Hexamita inflata]
MLYIVLLLQSDYLNICVQYENNIQKVQGGIYTALIIKILFYTRRLLRFRARAASKVDNLTSKAPQKHLSEQQTFYRIRPVNLQHTSVNQREFTKSIFYKSKKYLNPKVLESLYKNTKDGLQQLC